MDRKKSNKAENTYLDPYQIPKLAFKAIENFFRRISYNIGNTQSETDVRIISCIPIDVSELQAKVERLEKELEIQKQTFANLKNVAVNTDTVKKPAKDDDSNDHLNKQEVLRTDESYTVLRPDVSTPRKKSFNLECSSLVRDVMGIEYLSRYTKTIDSILDGFDLTSKVESDQKNTTLSNVEIKTKEPKEKITVCKTKDLLQKDRRQRNASSGSCEMIRKEQKQNNIKSGSYQCIPKEHRHKNPVFSKNNCTQREPKQNKTSSDSYKSIEKENKYTNTSSSNEFKPKEREQKINPISGNYNFMHKEHQVYRAQTKQPNILKKDWNYLIMNDIIRKPAAKNMKVHKISRPRQTQKSHQRTNFNIKHCLKLNNNIIDIDSYNYISKPQPITKNKIEDNTFTYKRYEDVLLKNTAPDSKKTVEKGPIADLIRDLAMNTDNYTCLDNCGHENCFSQPSSQTEKVLDDMFQRKYPDNTKTKKKPLKNISKCAKYDKVYTNSKLTNAKSDDTLIEINNLIKTFLKNIKVNPQHAFNKKATKKHTVPQKDIKIHHPKIKPCFRSEYYNFSSNHCCGGPIIDPLAAHPCLISYRQSICELPRCYNYPHLHQKKL